MSVSSQTVSLSDFIQERQWLEAYKRILLNIIYFGLFLFIGGIYIFPNNSGTQQTFYLLIALPFLLLFPFIVKELPWKSKYLYIYMAFPLYMFASHFWAPEENIQRGWLFFFRQLMCFFIFYFSIFLAIKKNEKFIHYVFTSLIIVGFFSALISLAEFFVTRPDSPYYYLKGFSIIDVDKAGAIYAIHLGFCLFRLTIQGDRDSALIRIFLTIALVVDAVAVYYTKTTGSLVIVGVAITLAGLILGYGKPMRFAVAAIFFAVVIAVSGVDIFKKIMSDPGVAARFHAISGALNTWPQRSIFGVGLSYKLPLHVPGTNEVFVHPHNAIVDVLRFGGVVGLLLFILHIFNAIYYQATFSVRSMEGLFLLGWCVCGLLASLFYGQQPFVRPGSYLWFFYWMPVTLIYVKYISKIRKIPSEENSKNIG